MAVLETTLQLLRMRRNWERRARENARHYVVTGQESWDDEEFYRSGKVTLEEEILNDLTNICQGRDPKQMRVLEIGCGAGRVTRAFAGYFGEVYAVDISREMVRQARTAVRWFSERACLPQQRQGPRRGPPQTGGIASGSEPPVPMDFAFSFMVFQHIPSRADH